MLLHIVDVSFFDNYYCIDSIEVVIKELKDFSYSLYQKERWLVLNKIDVLSTDVVECIFNRMKNVLNLNCPIFIVSGYHGYGVKMLCKKIDLYLN